MTDPELIKKVTLELMSNGKIIEAGWVSLRMMAIPPEASELQISEMRNSFFAGAHHLLTSVMTSFDPGAEPTDADNHRMDMIAKELDMFIVDFEAKNIRTKGTA